MQPTDGARRQSGGEQGGGQFGSASDVSVVSGTGGHRRHRRMNSMHVSDLSLYGVPDGGPHVGMPGIPQAPEAPPPEPPLPPPPPPPPDEPPPEPPDYRNFTFRHQRDENIYHTIPEPVYSDLRARHLYEKIRDEHIPWPTLEVAHSGPHRKSTNPYAPEPPMRTSSLKKKHPPIVPPKPQVIIDSKAHKSKFESGKPRCGRCKRVLVVLLVILLLGGIAAVAALYFLGFLTTGETGNDGVHTSTELHTEALDSTISISTTPVYTASYPNSTNCEEILRVEMVRTGAYHIRNPFHENRTGPLLVYCEMAPPSVGWLLIQRRQRERADFNRSWVEYEEGFGDLRGGDFWLGNAYIHKLTAPPARYVLRVDVKDKKGGSGWAEYRDFRLESPDKRYRLQLAGFKGNLANRFGGNKGFTFSTYDQDNDYANDRHCAKERGGGWWFVACGSTFLNGVPGDVTERGLSWSSGQTADAAIVSVVMKIRPDDNAGGGDAN